MSNFLAANLRLIVSGEAQAARPEETIELSSVSNRFPSNSSEDESDEEASELLLPSGFPRILERAWHIDKLLGRGSFGSVY